MFIYVYICLYLYIFLYEKFFIESRTEFRKAHMRAFVYSSCHILDSTYVLQKNIHSVVNYK